MHTREAKERVVGVVNVVQTTISTPAVLTASPSEWSTIAENSQGFAMQAEPKVMSSSLSLEDNICHQNYLTTLPRTTFIITTFYATVGVCQRILLRASLNFLLIINVNQKFVQSGQLRRLKAPSFGFSKQSIHTHDLTTQQELFVYHYISLQKNRTYF